MVDVISGDEIMVENDGPLTHMIWLVSLQYRGRDTQREDIMGWLGLGDLQAKACQALPEHHQKLEGDKEGFPSRFQKEHGSADSLIGDF